MLLINWNEINNDNFRYETLPPPTINSIHLLLSQVQALLLQWVQLR